MRQRQLRVTNHVESTLPIFGVDLNGVLANAHAQLVREIEATFGLTILPEGITSYDGIYKRVSNFTGKDNEIHAWLRARVNAPDFIMKLKPNEGLHLFVGGINDLPVEPRIITGHAYKELTVAATKEWCEQQGITWQIDFVREKDGWARQTKSRWIVEDNPSHVLAISDMGQDTIIYNQPYNQEVLEKSFDGKITRVNSLLDILTVVSRDLQYEMLSSQRSPIY